MGRGSPGRTPVWALLALVAGTAGCGGDGGTDVVIDADRITEPGHYIRNFGVDGLPRNFEVYVPPSVDFSRPSPLLLAFHGNPQTSAQMRAMTDFDAVADTTGLVVVYPNKANNADWAWGCDVCSAAALNGIDDEKYVSAVIDKMALDMEIDLDRVYASGFSQGGLMTFRLACRADDRFAAFATVGSLMWTWHRGRCDRGTPKPFLMIQGTEDPTFLWEGEVGTIGESLPGPVVRDFFAERNGCEGAAADEDLPDVAADGTTTTVRVFGPCAGGEVRFYRVDGGGHTWPGTSVVFGPGLGVRSDDFSASQEIVAFLLRHRR